MANGKIRFGKQSGGQLALIIPDGVTNTEVVVPESGILATRDNLVGFKNYIINGNMTVAQRGNGPFTTSGTYNIDQWFSFFSSSTGSNISRVWTYTEGFYAQVQVASGADTITLEQKVEQPYLFNGKTLTLSYKLFKGSYTGNTISYSIALVHSGGRTILYTGTHTIDNTNSSRKKFTFTMPDLSGYTLNANSYLEIRPVEVINLGHTGTFGIADVQLEEGSVATAFENRPIGLELILCQRYYQVLNTTFSETSSTIGANSVKTVSLQTTMRINPIVLENNEGGGGVASVSLVTSTNTLRVYHVLNAAGWYRQSFYVLSAEL